jgi:membrane associated rhomboid family serine protease
VRAGRPPASERARRWWAARPTLVTSVIIAANLTIFVWGLIDAVGDRSLFSSRSGAGVQSDLGLFAPAIDELGEWYRILTSGFVHAGLLHVAFNMFILFRIGATLEPTLGSLRFGLTYVACLLCGSAGALLIDPNALTVGASGAVFGMMGVYVAAARARRIPIMQTDIGGLLVINLILTFVIPRISIGGHIGGLVGGLICGTAFFWGGRRPGSRGWIDLLVPIVLGALAFGLCLWAAAQWQSRL